MSFQVKTAMNEKTETVTPETPIDVACQKMIDHKISGLPVVDADGELVGIVTERDILTLLSDVDSKDRTVFQFMTTDVHTVTEESLLTDVAEMFIRFGRRRFPVVRHGKLVGIIARRDLMRFISGLRDHVRATVC